LGKDPVKYGPGIAVGCPNARRSLITLTVSPYRNVSGAEDIMDFQRLIDLAEPFGAVGRTATSALIER
jgi:hypothetical protein